MTDLSPITGGTVPSPPSLQVSTIRTMLGEAGEQFRHVIKEEFGHIIPEADNSYSVYTRRKGIHQVVGVYYTTDSDKENNLYVGLGSYTTPDGGFIKLTGVITLSPNYSYVPMKRVKIDYVHLEGLRDGDIDVIVNWSKAFVRRHTNNTSISFNESSDEWWGLMTIAKFACMMAMNVGSVLQAGYNLRIEEFAVETKAWGEGMIAQFLLTVFKDEVEAELANFGWGIRMALATKERRFNDSPGSEPTSEMLL